MQRMMGVSSGLELLTLPHGHQLRLDLLERCAILFFRAPALESFGMTDGRVKHSQKSKKTF